MQSYWNEVKGIEKLQRGMYIILPLRYDAEVECMEKIRSMI